jgi:hypothetical protein
VIISSLSIASEQAQPPTQLTVCRKVDEGSRSDNTCGETKDINSDWSCFSKCWDLAWMTAYRADDTQTHTACPQVAQLPIEPN